MVEMGLYLICRNTKAKMKKKHDRTTLLLLHYLVHNKEVFYVQ